MISLAWPWLLLLLPLPWLVRRYLRAAAPRTGKALRLPFLAELSPGRAHAGAAYGRRGYRLAWLAWALLLLAAAQPRWLGEPVRLPVAGRDLMLAVDVSGSMEQQDYRLNGRPVNRLDMVKAVAGEFIERREGDRLGLILFGSRAYLQTPLTYDRATVRAMLDEAVIGLAGRDTAIGDAIAVAIKRLKEQAQEHRVLILLTDGANTVGNIAPVDAARIAARAGVRIYTIGIGGAQAGRRTPFGMLAPRGSDLDPVTLQAIAVETGGRYFQATDTAELARVYEELDSLEPSVRESLSLRPMRALFIWPAAAALLISVGLAAVRLPRARRRAAGAEVGKDAV